MDTKPIEYWITERHMIYLRKQLLENKPIPSWANPEGANAVSRDFSLGRFSLDPIFQEYRFCNVFRELDTVTMWIEENIRKPYAKHPNLWLMLCIARTINWPPTLQYLFKQGCMPTRADWKPIYLATALEEYAALGNKVYTGAYMIRAESDPKKEWFSWSKHRYIAEIVIGRLWEDKLDWEAFLTTDDPKNQKLTLKDVWELFQTPRYIGWGPFMAYEVVTDLRHTRYLRNAPDIMTWANAGPGALRGLNRLDDFPVDAGLRPAAATRMMAELLESLNTSLPTFIPRLEMRDVEHSLCEVDKYLRVKNGEGRPRAKYIRGRGY